MASGVLPLRETPSSSTSAAGHRLGLLPSSCLRVYSIASMTLKYSGVSAGRRWRDMRGRWLRAASRCCSMLSSRVSQRSTARTLWCRHATCTACESLGEAVNTTRAPSSAARSTMAATRSSSSTNRNTTSDAGQARCVSTSNCASAALTVWLADSPASAAQWGAKPCGVSLCKGEALAAKRRGGVHSRPYRCSRRPQRWALAARSGRAGLGAAP